MEQNRSATIIQASWRGYLLRKKFREHRCNELINMFRENEDTMRLCYFRISKIYYFHQFDKNIMIIIT